MKLSLASLALLAASASAFTTSPAGRVSTSLNIAPGETKTFTVQLRAFDGSAISARSTIYLEATAGVLNRQRVLLDENGQGSFALTAADLAPGETLRIKSGFRYFPGAFEKSVTVE